MTKTVSALYIVYLAPERPTDRAEEVGRFGSCRAAERAARKAVAGPRGAVNGCIPACASPTVAIDGFAPRDGGEDAQCSWIERVGGDDDDEDRRPSPNSIALPRESAEIVFRSLAEQEPLTTQVV